MQERLDALVVGAGPTGLTMACELLRRFTESGHDVTVVPTAAALHFVGAATWSALSGKPVTAEVWDDVADVPHVRLGQQAELDVVDRELAWNDGLALHRRAADFAALFTRVRSAAKYSGVAGAAALLVTPATSSARSRVRCWSFRISSRTYSLLLAYSPR